MRIITRSYCTNYLSTVLMGLRERREMQSVRPSSTASSVAATEVKSPQSVDAQFADPRSVEPRSVASPTLPHVMLPHWNADSAVAAGAVGNGHNDRYYAFQPEDMGT